MQRWGVPAPSAPSPSGAGRGPAASAVPVPAPRAGSSATDSSAILSTSPQLPAASSSAGGRSRGSFIGGPGGFGAAPPAQGLYGTSPSQSKWFVPEPLRPQALSAIQIEERAIKELEQLYSRDLGGGETSRARVVRVDPRTAGVRGGGGGGGGAAGFTGSQAPKAG